MQAGRPHRLDFPFDPSSSMPDCRTQVLSRSFLLINLLDRWFILRRVTIRLIILQHIHDHDDLETRWLIFLFFFTYLRQGRHNVYKIAFILSHLLFALGRGAYLPTTHLVAPATVGQRLLTLLIKVQHGLQSSR